MQLLAQARAGGVMVIVGALCLLCEIFLNLLPGGLFVGLVVAITGALLTVMALLGISVDSAQSEEVARR